MSKITAQFLKCATILHLLNLQVSAKLLYQQEITYSNCIQELSQGYFIGNSVSILLPKFSDKTSETFVKRLYELYSVTVIDKNKKSIASPLNKPVNILFLISSRLDLTSSIKYLQQAQIWNPLAHALVILRNEQVMAKQKSLLNMSEMKKIFRVFGKEHLIQVKLILFDEYDKLKIFGWFPYDDENNCGKSVQIVRPLGECLSDEKATDGKVMIKTKYSDLPIIPRTFNNCPLTVTALKMEPYTVCNHQWKCDNGIEILLFESVSKTLNLNLKLKAIERLDDTVYNSLLRRESDLLIGGKSSLTRMKNKRFTQTVPYYQDELTWCVPEATTLNLWLNFWLIFDGETWGYFTFVVLVAGSALYYFYKFYSHQENWCYCVTAGFFMTASVPIPFNPTHPLLRLFTLFFLIYGLLVTTTFNSFLMSTITNPIKYNQISTKQGLINNSMELYAENETFSLYNTDRSEFSEYFVQNFRSCTDMNSCLATFLSSSSNNIAIAASREHAINSPLLTESKIYCFEKPEHIYVYSVAALAHEHFHLLEAINRQIQIAVESGLIIKWKADSKLTKKPKIDISGPYPFSFHHISACIVALAVGYTLAGIAFAWECYFSYKNKTATNNEPALWRVCEKIWVTTERNSWSEILRYFRWKRGHTFPTQIDSVMSVDGGLGDIEKPGDTSPQVPYFN